MVPLIEFCESNLNQGSQLVIDKLRQRKDVDVDTYGCMSECSFCARALFCMFEGERVSGKTPQELLENIEMKIDEWHEFFL